MNIVLVGMRGSGKSNLSRRLAVLIKRPVLSLDTLISYERDGASIPEIVAEPDGWRGFRDLEFQVVEKAAKLPEIIIDAGGGVLVDLDEAGEEIYSERKVAALKKTGCLVWLRGDIPTLVEKVANDPSRPALSEVESAQALMERRLPFYQRAADLVIDIDGKKRKHLAGEILAKLPFEV